MVCGPNALLHVPFTSRRSVRGNNVRASPILLSFRRFAVLANCAKFGLDTPKGTPALVTLLPASAFNAGEIVPLTPRPLILPPRANNEPPEDIRSRSDSVSAVDCSSLMSKLNRVFLLIRVSVVSNSLRAKPPSCGSARSNSAAKEPKLSFKMKLITRWSGRKPYFNATSSGKI